MNERTAQHYQEVEARNQAELDVLRELVNSHQEKINDLGAELEQAEDDCNAMAAQVVYWRNRVAELRKELKGRA